MALLTVAICSYNRANMLTQLIAELRSQNSPLSYEILVVDNNSTDNTQGVLNGLKKQEGPRLRFCKEERQGIAYARNRAIEECLDSDFMVFIDDDELPANCFIEEAVKGLADEEADCVGGKIDIDLDYVRKPAWLTDELLGFLGKVDYGEEEFWITDDKTPIWSGNVGYRMSLFREDPQLRFDTRYNRAGSGLGGGEDAVMFRELLRRGCKIRYRPEMCIKHLVDYWKLQRRYFLKLHYVAGCRYGRYQTASYERSLFGVPPFMLVQLFNQVLKMTGMYFQLHPNALRQAMNCAHALGTIKGRFDLWQKME